LNEKNENRSGGVIFNNKDLVFRHLIGAASLVFLLVQTSINAYFYLQFRKSLRLLKI